MLSSNKLPAVQNDIFGLSELTNSGCQMRISVLTCLRSVYYALPAICTLFVYKMGWALIDKKFSWEI